jgi:diguanylate cyclase (GGDEF)-like protein/PAS domain S-box-containing protein
MDIPGKIPIDAEELLNSLVETSPFGVGFSRDGLIHSANQVYLKMFGYADISEIRGHSLLNVIAPQSRDDISERIKKRAQGLSVENTYETLALRKDNTVFPILISAKRVNTTDGPLTIAFIVDLTKQKCNEIKFQTLFESSRDAVMLLDAGGFFDCNEQTLKLFGLGSKQEFCKNHPADLSPPQQPSGECSITLANKHIALAMAQGSHRFEWIHRRADNGMEFPVDVQLSLFELNGGKALQASVRDISQHKLAEAELHRVQTSLVAAQNLARVGSWEWNVQSNSAQWSDETFRIFNIDKNDLSEHRKNFLDLISPLDRSLVDQALSDALSGKRSYDIEYRVRLDNGTNKVIHALAEVIRDPEGNSLLMRGTVQDITERKQAEENLRIIASVFDNSQEGILISDSDNKIVDVNPAFTIITGYSREEVLGLNPKVLSSGHQTKSFYVKMWQSLQSEKSWKGEVWDRRKSGEIYASQLSISVVCDDNGKVLRYVAVFSDITHIKNHEAELSRIAHYDALTGIPNRVLLADRMKQAIAQTKREKRLLSICYLDLDGFKPINDLMGHAAGDQVLIEVANRIGASIRGGDTVARLGGDEFVVLLLGQEKGEEFVATLQRILLAISEPIILQGKAQTLSASIGVSIYPLDDEDSDTLLRHADQAMYVAKQSGKNRFHIYDPAMDKRARSQNDFLRNIQLALDGNQFVLFYQPKINLKTKQLIGAEALIRWWHPERGLLSPAEFLPQIENTYLDIKLGEWVTATALAQMSIWHKEGFDIEISINISGFHLESLNFVEKLKAQLQANSEIEPRHLQIEVLETVAITDISTVRKVINECSEIGVSFALDDFGTGYSSLAYLSKLPVDALKIDQSFVRDMLEDKGDMAIVQGIIALAKAFDRQTVAEGIETDGHYQALLEIGCELGQGYGIAHPMPACELLNWQKS